MLTEQDKQILLDMAETIESGLMRIADAIPDHDGHNVSESIMHGCENIEKGLNNVARSIERLARAFEKE